MRSFKSAKDAKEDETARDEETDDNLFQNTESNGRFHSDWCSMMYSRLMLAKNVLSSDGIIFISIGQAELDNTIKMCDEVFGAANRAGVCSRQMKTGNNQGKYFTQNIDYIVVYVKNDALATALKDDMSQELIDKVVL